MALMEAMYAFHAGRGAMHVMRKKWPGAAQRIRAIRCENLRAFMKSSRATSLPGILHRQELIDLGFRVEISTSAGLKRTRSRASSL
jgi:hypothetical protein